MIQHNRPTFGTEESRAVQRVLEGGWVAQGPQVEAFEQEFCRYLGLPEGHAVAVSSGSAALYLALWAAGVKEGKVAIPALSCASLRNAVLMAGATPMGVDCAAGGANLDLDRARALKPAATIVAHMFGIPSIVRPEAGEILIEDCAQSLGAEVESTGASKNKVGLQGTLGVFSFAATKLMTAGGQGGMIVSRERALVDAIRDYRAFDCRRDSHARFNFTLTDVQAAIGREQLYKLDGWLERRATIYRLYVATGRTFVGSTLAAGTRPARFRAVLVTDSPDAWIAKFASRSIKAIVPIEDWELLGVPTDVPNALALTRSTVSIPLFPSLTEEQVTAICEVLEEGP